LVDPVLNNAGSLKRHCLVLDAQENGEAIWLVCFLFFAIENVQKYQDKHNESGSHKDVFDELKVCSYIHGNVLLSQVYSSLSI